MIILFDGVCNLCNGAINFIIDRDDKKVFRFAALQSEIGQEILKKYAKNDTSKLDSIVLEKDGKIYQKSDAVLEIAKNLQGFWRFFSIFKLIPTFIRDMVYDLIARNRYKVFGKSNVCRVPTPELKARFLS